MTAFVSIAIGKKPSKRAAKGINFSGATSKRARRDGRHEEHENVPTRRPIIDASTVIADSLDGVLCTRMDLAPYWGTRSRRRPGPSVRTSQSPGYVCLPGQRRKVSRKDLIKFVTAQLPELPTHDEAGRPIVYKTDDAWNHRAWR